VNADLVPVFPPDPNELRVRASGEQFSGSSSVKLYAVWAIPPEGAKISDYGILLGSPPTDADGKFGPVEYSFFMPLEPFYIVADYHNGDDIYQPRLDAISGAMYRSDIDPPLDGGITILGGQSSSSTRSSVDLVKPDDSNRKLTSRQVGPFSPNPAVAGIAPDRSIAPGDRSAAPLLTLARLARIPNPIEAVVLPEDPADIMSLWSVP
jgi:hypothetical protein